MIPQTQNPIESLIKYNSQERKYLGLDIDGKGIKLYEQINNMPFRIRIEADKDESKSQRRLEDKIRKR